MDHALAQVGLQDVRIVVRELIFQQNNYRADWEPAPKEGVEGGCAGGDAILLVWIGFNSRLLSLVELGSSVELFKEGSHLYINTIHIRYNYLSSLLKERTDLAFSVHSAARTYGCGL